MGHAAFGRTEENKKGLTRLDVVIEMVDLVSHLIIQALEVQDSHLHDNS